MQHMYTRPTSSRKAVQYLHIFQKCSTEQNAKEQQNYSPLLSSAMYQAKKVTDEKKRMPQWRSKKLSEGKQWPNCLDRVQHQRLPKQIQWTNPLIGKERHRTLFNFFRRQLRLSRDYIGGRKREALGRISKEMWVSFREGILQSTEGRFSGYLLTRF